MRYEQPELPNLIDLNRERSERRAARLANMSINQLFHREQQLLAWGEKSQELSDISDELNHRGDGDDAA